MSRSKPRINLLSVLPPTVIQSIIASRLRYENGHDLFNLNYETRVSILDLIRLGKYNLSQGKAYGFGDGYYGKLGDGNIKRHEVMTPIPIDISDQFITQVSAGYDYSLFLTENGQVFALGDGIFGKLGNGIVTENYALTPTPINTSNIGDQRIIQVEAGETHTILLTENGQSFTCGEGSAGVLGDGILSPHSVGIPSPINTSNIGDQRIIQVSSGYNYSLFLTENGQIFACGSNGQSQLGTGSDDTGPSDIPIPVDLTNIGDQQVIQISAGDIHSLLLTNTGQVYSWGDGTLGMLGDGIVDEHTQNKPTLIDTSNIGDQRIVNVVAGEFHSLILNEEGRVFAFGSNLFGRLGIGQVDLLPNTDFIGDFPPVGIPTEIDTTNIGNQRIVDMAAGNSTSLFLTESGQVFNSGLRDVDEIEKSKYLMYSVPDQVDTSSIGNYPITQISLSSLHALLLT